MPVYTQAVVSDVPSCGGVAFAKEQGIATLTYPASKKGLFPGLSKQELVQQLTEQHQADFVLLAGYLKVGFWGGGGGESVCKWLVHTGVDIKCQPMSAVGQCQQLSFFQAHLQKHSQNPGKVTR